ncbi:hypothetical protein QBC33DRAFT_603634 [Phialemonium atrogriseum]|uniref:Uncharacterized protein n=1 Tax=Phialemonium atrogriseum TaxID=1093897 RepID=A0AAJ0BP57_9PEZI|nr:uncharacterized protein QBC33DRAFT_603634 [Phialemonium atrogriseum]KAK1761903.1 hypothetical protein QBC33DRAFT_603634 [Phialemonium atrogriseum]
MPRDNSPSSSAASASKLANTKISLLGALRSVPDFPVPSMNIMPLFQDPNSSARRRTHAALAASLLLQGQAFDATNYKEAAYKLPLQGRTLKGRPVTMRELFTLGSLI